MSALRLSWALIEQRKRNKPRFRNRLFGPLAAALGFTCEGLTAARTERCTMLAMQCSSGHCAMLRAVWSHGTCRAFSCATRRAGHCNAAYNAASSRWTMCNAAYNAAQGGGACPFYTSDAAHDLRCVCLCGCLCVREDPRISVLRVCLGL